MLRTFCSIMLAVCLSVALTGCHGSKYFTKIGAKQEAAGLTPEAAESYYTALLKKRSNVDAQIGLKKNGQLFLNSLLNDFAKQKNFGSNKDAVYAYYKAVDYKNKIQNSGVTLQIAEFYEQDYTTCKNAYLTQLYEEGTTLLEAQKFADAEKKFAEIKKIDPEFKDAEELGDIAYLEPLYNQAKSEMELKHYRAAHDLFAKVIQKRAVFKDAALLKKSCLSIGTYTIAILPFENATSTTGLDARAAAYTLEALTKINDPFLRIVDREHTEAILQEQKLQLSGIVDQNTAVVVGELVGAQALLTGTVLNYSESRGTMRSKQRDAYVEYKEKVLNKEDGKYYMQSKYRPTTYTEYYNTNSTNVSFQYKLISLKTGEIIKTEIIDKEINDEVLFGRFDGDFNRLFPASQGGLNLNGQDKRALNGLMQGRQELKSTTDLSNDAFNQISTKMQSEISSVMKNLVQ